MNKYINRQLAPKVLEAQRYFQVVVITGPRQSGKTSLCHHLFPTYKYVNLEDISLRSIAMENPTGFLDSLGDTAVIDEVQHVPDILSMIQVRVDELQNRKYILTGSSNFSLLKAVSQSLAGRAALFTLLPFSIKEVKNLVSTQSIDKIITNGLYPRVIDKDIPNELYYRSYYNTYVERDLRDLLKVKNILAFNKFIRLLAARIGSEFNASALARDTGVTSVTIKEWLSILMTSYIAFPLMPYYMNISKQLTKMPKIYFYDTGLACFLLGIYSDDKLKTHQMRGALFENLAICELLKNSYNQGKEPRLYFYREKSGLEVDALSEDSELLHLYEIKVGETLRKEYLANMKEIADNLNIPVTSSIIYNGENIPPLCINIRDI